VLIVHHQNSQFGGVGGVRSGVRGIHKVTE
jgi:hypothetical protein